MEYTSIKLKDIGVDVSSVISRLGGNELLYLNICHKFLQDQNFQLFQRAITTKNYEVAKIYIHTLKGVSANLGFIRLEHLCKAINDHLNCNDTISLLDNVNALSEEYYNIISVLK